ncbi:bifunctional diguanylate cyclase/phosphodiesterase [Denitromonas halophila]|uniref:EAL domain-containing protein n=1 Tax=Denitromonas halophila TaxID=1629404 RepID=A0A557QIE4_9RHOO|nr:EAL domain-containing protein [Denitromonas halophila]TVO52673.1 EAL domain-containing protein [Denitromonas halophila]
MIADRDVDTVDIPPFQDSSTQMTHARKILLAFVVSAVLSTALLGGFLHLKLNAWAEARLEKGHASFVEAIARNMNGEIARSQQLLETVAASVEFRHLSALDQIDLKLNGIPGNADLDKRRMLERLLGKDDFSVLFVLTPSGDHYLSHPYSVQRRLKKYNLADRPYFQAARTERRTVVSDMFVGSDGIQAVAIDVPVLNEAGEIVAHVGGVKHLTRLAKMLDAELIAPFDRGLLIDQNGSVIAITAAARLPATHKNAALHGRLPPDAAPSMDRFEDENGLRWLRFRAPLTAGWQLSLMRRADLLKAEIAPQVQSTALLGTAIVLISSLLGVGVAVSLARRWQQADAALEAAKATLEDQVEARTAELAQSEQRHRALFEHSPLPMLLYDASSYAIMEANDAAVAQLGYTKHAFLTMTVHDLVHNDTPPHDIATPHESNDAAEQRYRLRKQNDEPIETLVWSRPTHINGTPARIALIHDITREAMAQRALQESEWRFRKVFQVSPVAGSITTLEGGRYFEVNDAYTAAFGWSREELLADNAVRIGLWPDPDQRLAWVQCLREQNFVSNYSVRLRDKGLRLHDILMFASVIDFAGERCVLTMLHDVTAQREAEARVRTLSQAIEQSPVSVLITDRHSVIEYVNHRFEEITGYTANEVIGKKPSVLKSGQTPPSRYEAMWAALSNGKAWEGEFQNMRKNGELFWERAHIAPVFDAAGDLRHYLAVKEDITHQKRQEEKILRQAHFDPLTDLPNRFLALDRLTQLIKEAARQANKVAVLFIDLDDFKKINDNLGHEAGDHVLIEAAARLSSAVRDEDTVGRLGGDEFIVLLGGLSSPGDALPVAESLIERFRDSFQLDGRELMLTASIGIAVFPEDGDNPATLLRHADTAMYHSKAQGRNICHFFTDAMNLGMSRRLQIEEQLHGALAREEFQLCYQPLINIARRAIIGAEALLRWRNPRLGAVPPDEFIPVAEHTDLIIDIGKHVLSQAIEQVAYWRGALSPDFKVAVNLSPRQFRDTGLASFIEQTLARHGVPGNALELEITEGVLMGGHTHINDALVSLNRMGVHIAMDDFGTGYSSLSYLRSYPFDTLKIDRSFVGDITIDAADRELVNATIAMAHGLGLSVVAEGVETEAQLDYLHSRGCDIAQGYLFGKPVPAEAFNTIFGQPV